MGYRWNVFRVIRRKDLNHLAHTDAKDATSLLPQKIAESCGEKIGGTMGRVQVYHPWVKQR